MKLMKLGKDRGFTIIELMIALTVLSVILVMGSTILLQIGNLYNKGVNAANLQNTSRNLVADISSTVQLSAADPANCTPSGVVTCYASQRPHSNGSEPIYAYCIGDTRYSYVLNRKLGVDLAENPIAHTGVDTETPHVLWRDTMASASSTCQPLDISTDPVAKDGSSKPGPSPVSDGFEMIPRNVRLTRFRVTEAAANTGVYNLELWAAYGDSDLVIVQADGAPTCSGAEGTQFCAISKISTSVVRRLK
jgi:prepilin-type N-terminal cleavage/methylation domain-containing protein